MIDTKKIRSGAEMHGAPTIRDLCDALDTERARVRGAIARAEKVEEQLRFAQQYRSTVEERADVATAIADALRRRLAAEATSRIDDNGRPCCLECCRTPAEGHAEACEIGKLLDGSLVVAREVAAARACAEAKVADLERQVAAVSTVLRDQKCPECRNDERGRYVDCDFCGDSTYDHHCNSKYVPCDSKACLARRTALANTRAVAAGYVDVSSEEMRKLLRTAYAFGTAAA